MRLPPDEALADELLALKWRPTPEGRIRIGEKTVLKAELGRSPDRADAVSMAVWASARELVVDISGMGEINAGLWKPPTFDVREERSYRRRRGSWL